MIIFGGGLRFAAAPVTFGAMITPLYAAALALIFIALSIRVITYRRGNQLGLGDHGDKSLMKRMRAHANFAEYAPFGLLLMLLVELQEGAGWVLHLTGLLLLLGRAGHAYGFSASPPKMNLRVGGMLMTFASIVVSVLAILWLTAFGG
ncbi:MAPEG family protein [Pseudooctadecabacter sp.]|uniref:MAPEG family protein n=1 Tax=Pseudooctadecabacter sp. TaxID=1966338 RepID=UPI0035C80CF6